MNNSVKVLVSRSRAIGGVVTIAMTSVLGLYSFDNAHAESTFAGSTFNERAIATIESCSDGRMQGFATLSERASSEGVKEVDVYMYMSGLTEGKHAVHIHETGVCKPCSGAKGHFDPGNFGMTNPDANHPYHAGDLINIDIEDGIGVMTTKTTRVTLSDGPISIFDEDGSAFIVHDNSDSYCPNGAETGCAGGSRAACGIIKRVSPTDDFELRVSTTASRHFSTELADAELSGAAYVFLSPVYPNQSVHSVKYYLNGQKTKVESYAPYDLFGTWSNGTAAPFYTDHRQDGSYNISAIIEHRNGERSYVSASFKVRNRYGSFGNRARYSR